MSIAPDRPIAVYYEHPAWFVPLFAELDRRGVPYVPLRADRHHFDPSEPVPYSLVFNRMSPSAYLRGHGHAIFYTLAYLAHLRRQGVRVINGHGAFQLEISKADQLALLASLGLPFPATRVFHRAADAPDAASGLRFPVVVKPNIGGSGAGVRLFLTREALAAVSDEGTLDLGLDGTALVQEFIPAEESRIVRVEVLGGSYLYGIRIYTPGDSFDLCPADVCQHVDGTVLDASLCAVDAPARGLRVESHVPPEEIRRQVEQILFAAGIEIGGVEYLVDARDGQRYFYDVNALSNFVADAPTVIGFDPFARLADYLIGAAEAAVAGAGVA